MNNNASPLYPRIINWISPASPCCDDDYAECPDCGDGLCVFCQDACEGCGTSVF